MKYPTQPCTRCKGTVFSPVSPSPGEKAVLFLCAGCEQGKFILQEMGQTALGEVA